MDIRTTHVITQQYRGEFYCNILKGLNIILLSAMDSQFKKVNTVPVQIVNITRHI